MNRKILLLIAFLMVASYATAQYESLIATSNPAGAMGELGIVRAWRPTVAMACYETGGRAVLLRASGTQFSLDSIVLSSKFHVKDMRVLNDELFFCGVHNDVFNSHTGQARNVAFLAHLHIPDFDNANVHVDFIELDSTIANELNQMVVYDDGSGTPHIVALGSGTNASRRYTCAVECSYDATAVNIQYTVVEAVSGERFYDVVETRNFVVVEGNYYNNPFAPFSIALHRGRKDDVLQSSDFRVLHYFPIQDEPLVDNVVEAIHDDIFIVASSSGNPSTLQTRVRAVDANALQMVASQEIRLPNKAMPMEIKYFRAHDKVVMTQFGPLDDPQVFFSTYYNLEWHPTADYDSEGLHLNKDKIVRHMDRLDDNYYVSAYKDHWFVKDVRVAPNASGSQCYTPFKFTSRVVPNVNAEEMTQNLSPLQKYPLLQDNTFTVGRGRLLFPCVHR